MSYHVDAVSCELDLGPLEEQPVLLTAELSPQPLVTFLCADKK